MNTICDYHDIYLKAGVLVLAGVFEKFFNTCSEYYGLDPCHYFSSPGLSWGGMLKLTEIELGFISDIDMYSFVEKEMRRLFLTLLKDLVKPAINICNHMMIVNQINVLFIWTQVIS